jgi:hypothetical protein
MISCCRPFTLEQSTGVAACLVEELGHVGRLVGRVDLDLRIDLDRREERELRGVLVVVDERDDPEVEVRLRRDPVLVELGLLRRRERLVQQLLGGVVVHEVVLLHRLLDLLLDVASPVGARDVEAHQDREKRDETACPHGTV